MKKTMLFAGGAVVVLLAGGAYSANVFSGEIAGADVDAAAFSDSRIEAGENLALLGDCSACHTPAGTRHMSGGVGLPTPFGTVYSTNITPDPETGIGSWSFAAFDRAMREGIDRRGRHLYPVFPYDHFAGVAEEDMAALYEYLMSQEPVQATPVENDLAFPYAFRPLLAGWKVLFHRPWTFTPNPEFNEEENRGAYLATTLGHCSACHSPRNALGAVKGDRSLAGGEAEGWLAPPLGEASISPLGWDEDDYADYLFDGWSQHHGIAGGPMTTVVDHLYEADEDDVYSLAVWLARITPPVDEDARAARLDEIAALDLPESFDPATVAEGAPDQVQHGAQVFKDRCVECHEERISESQPISLGLTYAVNAPAPTNVFNAVVHGIEPSFGSSDREMEPVDLTAEDLAAVTAFLRWHFTDLPAWEDLDGQSAAAKEVQLD